MGLFLLFGTGKKTLLPLSHFKWPGHPPSPLVAFSGGPISFPAGPFSFQHFPYSSRLKFYTDLISMVKININNVSYK
jgi:hypothetical protein